MAAKKVTFKYYGNDNLAPITLKPTDGELKIKPYYFRITYDRKSSSYKSILLDSILHYFAFQIDDQFEYTKNQASSTWSKLSEQLIQQESNTLNLIIEWVKQNNNGEFDHQLFNLNYKKLSFNALNLIDGTICQAIAEKLKKDGFLTTSSLVNDLVQGRGLEDMRRELETSILFNLHYSRYARVIALLEELNPMIKNQIIDDEIKTNIKAIETLYKIFNFNFQFEDAPHNAYLSYAHFVTEKGKYQLVNHLSSVLSHDQISTFLESPETTMMSWIWEHL